MGNSCSETCTGRSTAAEYKLNRSIISQNTSYIHRTSQRNRSSSRRLGIVESVVTIQRAWRKHKAVGRTDWDADLDLSGEDGAGIPLVKKNQKLRQFDAKPVSQGKNKCSSEQGTDNLLKQLGLDKIVNQNDTRNRSNNTLDLELCACREPGSERCRMFCLKDLFKGQSIILSESLVEQMQERKSRSNLLAKNQDSGPIPEINFSPRVSQLGSNEHSYQKPSDYTETPQASQASSKAISTPKQIKISNNSSKAPARILSQKSMQIADRLLQKSPTANYDYIEGIGEKPSTPFKYFRQQVQSHTPTSSNIPAMVQTPAASSSGSTNFIQAANQESMRPEFLLSMPDGQPSQNLKNVHDVYKNGDTYKGYVNRQTNKREGRGTMVFADQSRFDGFWLDDKANGKGRMIYVEGGIYEGDWREGRQEGHGVFIYPDASQYEGSWLNNQKHGFGTEKWPDGTSYEGEYYKGKQKGKGTFRWPDGSFYVGAFTDNKFNGFGTYQWSSGRVYTGQWERNMMHGKGVLDWKDGRVFRGTFQKGKKHQQGSFEWGDGRVYRGAYHNDKKHGFGIFEWPNGRKYIGQWENGVQQGLGVYISPNGSRRQGEWSQGKLMHWLQVIELDEGEGYEEDEQNQIIQASLGLQDENRSQASMSKLMIREGDRKNI